jgi:hypothetical protein
VATLTPGSKVRLAPAALRALRFPPPDAGLVVVVHNSALRAQRDRHTQVACMVDLEAKWLGALGEDLLVPQSSQPDPRARAACARRLVIGERLWDIVKPGLLVQPTTPRPLSTIYDGSALRPWVVIGETAIGQPIAVPLNEPTNPKWWTPVVSQAAMSFPGNNTDAQVELAHVWTLPPRIRREGWVRPEGAALIERAVRQYFDLAQA